MCERTSRVRGNDEFPRSLVDDHGVAVADKGMQHVIIDGKTLRRKLPRGPCSRTTLGNYDAEPPPEGSACAAYIQKNLDPYSMAPMVALPHRDQFLVLQSSGTLVVLEIGRAHV